MLANTTYCFFWSSPMGVIIRVSGRPSRTTSMGTSWPTVSWRTATTNSSPSATLRSPILITTSFSRSPAFSAGLPGLMSLILAPEATLLLTETAVSPSDGCTILPSSISFWATRLTSLTGIAKPSPLALSDKDFPAVLMPMTSEFMLISGPPELPWLIDASVCTPSMTVSVSDPSPDSGTGRCSALMMPWVTVLRRPSGAPAAITSSPTVSFSESPSLATDRLSTLSTLSTARSVFGSRPTRFAGTSLPSLNTTVVLYWLGLAAASEMTWLLVTMYPRPSTTTPEPCEPSESLTASTVTTESAMAAATFANCPCGGGPLSLVSSVTFDVVNASTTSA